jgi:glutamate-5-semialdehyde dehydrogenase
MKMKLDLIKIAKNAQRASRVLSGLSCAEKNSALEAMAEALLRESSIVLKANKLDVDAAVKSRLARPLVERLTLNEKRIKDMADSLLELTRLADPVGEVMKAWRRPNGLWIHKVRAPIGVIAIIYESRPNVTSDCIGLCFKSGNSVILRGGSEALHSNLAIFSVLQQVLSENNIPEAAISMIASRQRSAVDVLLKLNDYIDLVIPRGGEGLIKKVVASSRIPVIKHYKGICHVFVDEFANLKMAQEICFNAKVQRPGVCNAMETMLVHKSIAQKFLPLIAKRFKKAGVEIRGCATTQKLIKWSKRATEKDFRTEYLDLKLSVRVVADREEAIEHINNYGSHHSDSIVTENYDNAMRFLRAVDSACVYVNASTRFTDGYQFGMGAEIGISTDKLHARGPMALEELTTYKYMVFGSGQVRT